MPFVFRSSPISKKQQQRKERKQEQQKQQVDLRNVRWIKKVSYEVERVGNRVILFRWRGDEREPVFYVEWDKWHKRFRMKLGKEELVLDFGTMLTLAGTLENFVGDLRWEV